MRTRLLRAIRNRRIQQQVVNFVAANLLQHLLRKGLDRPQVRELQRQHRHGVARAVVAQGVVGGDGALGVARAEDDFVGLGLLEEELLDGFEALEKIRSVECEMKCMQRLWELYKA